MAGHEERDWRELCAAVTNEPDSKKLDSMVQELIRALDEGEGLASSHKLVQRQLAGRR
jgi:hypothetical protein